MVRIRLPLFDTRRQRERDDRLWLRESQRAIEYNETRLRCPCTKCCGRKKILVRNVREHLIRNGRDPHSRVWTGAGAKDSSDEEWDRQFWGEPEEEAIRVDATVDTRGMVAQAQTPAPDATGSSQSHRQEGGDTFEEADGVRPITSAQHVQNELRDGGEGDSGIRPAFSAERLQEEIRDAFDDADAIHQEWQEAGDEDVDVLPEIDENAPRRDTAVGHEDAQFDATALEESMEHLYGGARSSKLAATVLLMNLCTVHSISNSCANELFSILHRHLLPENNTLPQTYHAAKNLTGRLGLTYNSIHACERGCVLFRGPHRNTLECPKCGGRRYRDEARKMFPLKVLRHFPIIPRLQRMFMSEKISKLMQWHAENRSNQDGGDGLVRHPCDSKAWQHFHDNVDPTFSNDPRNAHFALAADGVNPFKQNRSSWSTWPVLLLNYNLPPWLSTKKFFMLLALLIPGRESVTSEVFDVYLEPLVDELLELWAGIPAYDVSKDLGSRSFQLRAMLLWTIHDFPGYGTVGGFSHQGYAACPWCGVDLGAKHSTELGKQTYGGTRRWLPLDHPYRSEQMKAHFDGSMENRPKPREVTVEEQIRHALECEAWREQGNRYGAVGDPSKISGIKRLSILFLLPYWKVSIDAIRS